MTFPYRYTHGNPEQAASWLKSILRERNPKLPHSFRVASYVILSYADPNDYSELPVNLGFFSSAKNTPPPPEQLEAKCIKFLEPMQGRKIRMETNQIPSLGA